MQCAKCDGEMKNVETAGVTVDRCEKCGGIWFDFEELEAAAEAENLPAECEATLAMDFDMVESPCPKCGGDGNMIAVKDPDHGFHIDICTVCRGRWLDGGELEELRSKGILESAGDFLRHILRLDD